MVGIHPEVMTLDSHLNQDIHVSVDRYVNLTSHLPDAYPNKFSKQTPKSLSKAHKRIWDPNLGIHQGAPVHKRIKSEIKLVVNKSYLDIFTEGAGH